VCYMAPQGSSQCDAPGMQALLKTPSGTFKDIVHGLACTACGLKVDGTVQCWGGLLAKVPATDVHLTSFAGMDQVNELCGLQADGSIRCWNSNSLFDPPSAPKVGSFSPYSCRSVTEESVKGWQGDGCHPLQQGFPSACACEVDGQCAAGEHCDAQKKSCTGAGGTALSCLAAANGACPNGRISVGGACARPCQAKTDCAGSQVCEQQRCVPPGHIPLAEQIVWGMARPQAPVHTISTYALSDFKATLLLKADIYVEASFKLFRKPRVWRLLDYHNAWDLGSTWKGWYAPGLEARYQHECENPRLDEPVTNRYPRPSTSNPFEAIFATHGIKDLSRHCGFLQGGGVCRYPQTLPAQQARPELYARGNSGTVSDLLRWCGDDLPRHAEDPAPSDNAQLSAGIADTAVWGKTVALDVWGRNRLCVNGVLWDDWLSALDGKGGSGAALEQTNCGYRPASGQSFSFPCKDATDAMLEIWGCTLVDSSPFATELVKQFPQLAVTSPRTGTKMIDLGQVFGPGSPYTLENMAPQIRFASAGSGTAWVPRLGERWLEAVDQCFGTRFEDPAENVCRCTGDDDCNSAAGERCSGGRCEQPRTLDGEGTCLKPDCSPVYQARQCPVVFLEAAVGPCRGDGKVEKSARYSEECDDGPAGSATCTPDCKLLKCLPPPAGMAAWWPLDERSGRAAAERVRGWNGAWAGAPVPVAGKVDWALQFDGVHDSVEVADAPQLNMGTGDFSIDAWVQTSAQGTQPIVDKRTSGAVGYTLFLFDGRLGIQLGDRNLPTSCSTDNSKSSCTNWIAPATMPSMADGKWHQVAVTVHRASGGGRLYADGVEVLAFDPTVRNQSLDNTAPLSIGRHHPNSSAGQGFWRGLLDEVELFRRALSAEEVRALFNADRDWQVQAGRHGRQFRGGRVIRRAVCRPPLTPGSPPPAA
jgi:Concanavalin A-like lectin/glucanases superfamily